MGLLRLGAALAIAGMAFAGCSAEEQSPGIEAVTRAAASQGGGIDPAGYAGDVTFRIPADLPTRGGPVPFVVFAGVGAASDTRLSVNAFADLRTLQARLPELLSGELESNCRRDIGADVQSVEGMGDRIIARGRVDAKFYTCRKAGTPEERRGIRLISQKVEVVAVATAKVENNCIAFSLLELELDPSGLLGGIANLLGLTDRIRDAVLESADELFEENPLCPKLPPELASLEPRYTGGGTREIGQRGLGAALVGSVDASAETLVELLAAVQKRWIAGGRQ